MSDLRQQWNETCLAAGIPSLSTEACAMILSIVYMTDNDENIVMNKKLQADIDYIKKRFHIEGGEIPDWYLGQAVKAFIMTTEKAIQKYGDWPLLVKDFFKEYYNIELRNPCI